MKKNNDYDMADQSQEPGMNLTRRRFLAGASALMAAPTGARLKPSSATAKWWTYARSKTIRIPTN